MVCSNCGTAVAVAGSPCNACGDTRADSRAEITARARLPVNSLDLYQAVIGPKRQDYYLRHFERYLETGGPGISWHWPAFFTTLFWLMYRKMWLQAGLYFIMPYVLLVAGSAVLAVVSGFTGQTGLLQSAGSAVWIVGFFVLPPLMANRLYFAHCTAKINEVSATTAPRERQIGELSAKGGTSNVVWIIIAIFCAMSTIGILAAVAIPAYQGYSGKSQLAEAERVGRDAANSVAIYFNEHRKMPETLAAAGFSAQAVTPVGALSLGAKDGSVIITMVSENRAINGKRLVLTPSIGEGDKLVWTCSSDGIPPLYQPISCKSTQ